MEIRLVKVQRKERAVLYRLLQYSLFEESLFDQNDMDDAALFAYPYFDLYFMEDDREAFFVREKISGQLLGFVMLNRDVQKVASGHSIAEFMVLPKYRRKRIGQQVAQQCFELHPGNWEVSPSAGSEAA